MKSKNNLFFPNPFPQTKDMVCPQAIEERRIDCSKKIKIKEFYHDADYFGKKRRKNN